jgi:hypothetical protein
VFLAYFTYLSLDEEKEIGAGAGERGQSQSPDRLYM